MRELFDRDELYAWLDGQGLRAWRGELEAYCQQRLTADEHGKMPDWISACEGLPEFDDANICGAEDVVRVTTRLAEDSSQARLRALLQKLSPWRKGPFAFFGVSIDSEWRSNHKWDRIAETVDWQGKTILDVGCGNGYYGWRMLSAGARLVLGCEPFPLYVMQFEAMRKYAPTPERHFVVPITDQEIADDLQRFDITLSMGVLYHRTSPIDHLQKLAGTLRPGGQLILETLIIESDKPEVLVPRDRYAKMRNVWFLPSIPMLEIWLQRSGFSDVQVIDVTQTTSEEQRTTEWMTFHSLENFVNSNDHRLTIEGYPGPIRATLRATSLG